MITSIQNRLTLDQPRTWFSIRAEADSADILIYDYIGWGGVSAADFAKDVRTLTAKNLTVRLNTPGGDVFDGLAIYNTLKGLGKTIHVKVDGLAASIGSIIAMAGETITMGESSFLMVHNPWALVIGNAGDMRGMADTLDKIGGSLASIYAGRARTTQAQAQHWMDDETWFTADEAKAAGLADTVEHHDAPADTAQDSTRFDLSGYVNLPNVLRAERLGKDASPDAGAMKRAELMRKRLELVQSDGRSR